MMIRAGLFALASVWASPSLFGQASTQPDFRTASRLVTIDVSVTDKRAGSSVEHLSIDNFRVLDEGRPQKISHFSHGDTAPPLSLFLVLEIAPNTAGENVLAIRDGLTPAFSKLRPDDKIGVIYFWYNGVASLQTLTTDRNKVLDAIAALELRQKELAPRSHAPNDRRDCCQGQNLAAALREGIRQSREASPDVRPVFAVISDDMIGMPRQEVLDAAQFIEKEEVAVNGLIKTTSPLVKILKPLPGSPRYIARNIEYYSGRTGGELVDVKGDDYATALTEVLGNIAGRYQISFIPDESRLDGKLHKVTVEVTLPPEAKSRSIVIRHRKEYLAETDAGQVETLQ